jgi:hypothetical protein
MKYVHTSMIPSSQTSDATGAVYFYVTTHAATCVMRDTCLRHISLMCRQSFALLRVTVKPVTVGAGPKGYAVDIRQRLGLLILEMESEAAGLIRITEDQARRTAQRLEGQIKTANERAPKKPKVAKVKVPKPPKAKVIKARKPSVAA